MRKFLISVLSTLLTSCGDPKVRQPLVEAGLNDMVYVSGGTYNMGSEKVGQWVHPNYPSPSKPSFLDLSQKGRGEKEGSVSR
jgi:hypothetical protein